MGHGLQQGWQPALVFRQVQVLSRLQSTKRTLSTSLVTAAVLRHIIWGHQSLAVCTAAHTRLAATWDPFSRAGCRQSTMCTIGKVSCASAEQILSCLHKIWGPSQTMVPPGEGCASHRQTGGYAYSFSHLNRLAQAAASALLRHLLKLAAQWQSRPTQTMQRRVSLLGRLK